MKSSQHNFKLTDFKQDTLDEFDDRCVTTLECEMCGNKISDVMDAPHIAQMAFDRGWRFQNDAVLCQHCTDNKR